MSGIRLYGDFETQSEADLPKWGAHLYAEHPLTKVLCVGYAVDDGPVRVTTPEGFGRLLTKIRFNSSTSFVAHNAAFELAIWNLCGTRLYGWPPLTVEQTDCTMIRAYAMGLPGGLDDCSAALGIESGKDMGGHRVMLKLSKPKVSMSKLGVIDFWTPEEVPEDFKRLYRYCVQDIVVEREVDKRLPALSDYEKRVWAVDQRINNRGLRIDVKAAKVAQELIEYELDRFNRAMQKVTEGAVMTCTQHDAIRRYLNEEHGLGMKSVDASSISKLLTRRNVPKKARQVAILRKLASKSSTSKIAAMLTAAQGDGRLRGLFQYHTSHTGRWGGRRVQPQNLPRGELKPEQIEFIFEALHAAAS